MTSGWIRLHRKIIESAAFADANLLKVWMWCLCKAAHKQNHFTMKTGRGNTIVSVEPGQFVFGKQAAAKELKMPTSSVRRRMKTLVELGNISLESSSHFTIVTINAWRKYQGVDHQPRGGSVANQSGCDNADVSSGPATDPLPDHVSAENREIRPPSTATEVCLGQVVAEASYETVVQQRSSNGPASGPIQEQQEGQECKDNKSAAVEVVVLDILRVIGHKHDADPFIWKVAFLVANGQLTQFHAISAAESVRDNSPDNPIGYFRAVLSDNIGGAGTLNHLMTTIPRWVAPQPLATGESDFGRPKRADTTCLNVED